MNIQQQVTEQELKTLFEDYRANILTEFLKAKMTPENISKDMVEITEMEIQLIATLFQGEAQGYLKCLLDFGTINDDDYERYIYIVLSMCEEMVRAFDPLEINTTEDAVRNSKKFLN